MGETYIYHYGIKGMKWGVRRTPAQLGHRPKRSIKEALSGIRKKKTETTSRASTGRKPLKEMSDEELRRALNRLDMEKRYSQYMSEASQKKQSRAKKVVADILESGVKTMANKAFEAAARKAFEKAKPEEKDTATKIDFDDISKAGDKALRNALQRLNTETAYRKALGEVQEARGGEKAVREALERMNKSPFRDTSVTIDDSWLRSKKKEKK